MCIPPIVARQRLGKDIPAATNTHATIRELFNACVCGSVCVSPIVARQPLGKDVPTVTKNCWRRRFLRGPRRIKGT
jgi:hypothetical protein